MKKILIKTSILTLIINLLLFGINFACAHLFHVLPLAVTIPGGDCIEHIGFGVELLEVFVMSSIYSSASNQITIALNIPSLIISLIITFITALIIYLIINKIKSKKSN